MKLLKYNKSKGEWVNTYSAILDKIPEIVFYLYPWGFKGSSLFLPNGVEIDSCYSSTPNHENEFCVDRWGDGFCFKKSDLIYKMAKGEQMLSNWPTREEFELFCLENGIDSFSVPFLTQEEICEQMLSVIETMDIKDIVDSLRI